MCQNMICTYEMSALEWLEPDVCSNQIKKKTQKPLLYKHGDIVTEWIIIELCIVTHRKHTEQLVEVCQCGYFAAELWVLGGQLDICVNVFCWCLISFSGFIFYFILICICFKLIVKIWEQIVQHNPSVILFSCAVLESTPFHSLLSCTSRRWSAFSQLCPIWFPFISLLCIVFFHSFV